MQWGYDVVPGDQLEWAHRCPGSAHGKREVVKKAQCARQSSPGTPLQARGPGRWVPAQ